MTLSELGELRGIITRPISTSSPMALETAAETKGPPASWRPLRHVRAGAPRSPTLRTAAGPSRPGRVLARPPGFDPKLCQRKQPSGCVPAANGRLTRGPRRKSWRTGCRGLGDAPKATRACGAVCTLRADLGTPWALGPRARPTAETTPLAETGGFLVPGVRENSRPFTA